MFDYIDQLPGPRPYPAHVPTRPTSLPGPRPYPAHVPFEGKWTFLQKKTALRDYIEKKGRRREEKKRGGREEEKGGKRKERREERRTSRERRICSRWSSSSYPARVFRQPQGIEMDNLLRRLFPKTWFQIKTMESNLRDASPSSHPH